MTLLVYSLCCLCLCVSSFGAFPVFRLPVRSLISMPKSLLFTPISHATKGSTRGTACGARWGVRRWGDGGPCVARRCLQPRSWCYPVVQFNMLDRFMIMGTSPDPVPAGD